jgi:hypothetical protein
MEGQLSAAGRPGSTCGWATDLVLGSERERDPEVAPKRTGRSGRKKQLFEALRLPRRRRLTWPLAQTHATGKAAP